VPVSGTLNASSRDISPGHVVLAGRAAGDELTCRSYLRLSAARGIRQLLLRLSVGPKKKGIRHYLEFQSNNIRTWQPVHPQMPGNASIRSVGDEFGSEAWIFWFLVSRPSNPLLHMKGFASFRSVTVNINFRRSLIWCLLILPDGRARKTGRTRKGVASLVQGQRKSRLHREVDGGCVDLGKSGRLDECVPAHN